MDLGAPFVFLNGDDTRKLLKDSKDIPSGKEIGLLATLAIFLKKGWIIVVALLAGGWTWIKSRIGRSRRNNQPAPQKTAAKEENSSPQP